jgi:hypothetical protein
MVQTPSVFSYFVGLLTSLFYLCSIAMYLQSHFRPQNLV